MWVDEVLREDDTGLQEVLDNTVGELDGVKATRLDIHLLVGETLKRVVGDVLRGRAAAMDQLATRGRCYYLPGLSLVRVGASGVVAGMDCWAAEMMRPNVASIGLLAVRCCSSSVIEMQHGVLSTGRVESRAFH